MIDPQIRARLLAMPETYRENVAAMITNHAILANAKVAMEGIKANVAYDLAKRWAETKSNEQTRNAELGGELKGNATYQEMLGAAQRAEEALKLDQMRLDSLRFERDCLIAVANNDCAFAEDPYAGERPTLRQEFGSLTTDAEPSGLGGKLRR